MKPIDYYNELDRIWHTNGSDTSNSEVCEYLFANIDKVEEGMFVALVYCRDPKEGEHEALKKAFDVIREIVAKPQQALLHTHNEDNLVVGVCRYMLRTKKIVDK